MFCFYHGIVEATYFPQLHAGIIYPRRYSLRIGIPILSMCSTVSYNSSYPLDFELGFEQVSYEVCEGDGIVNDTVYIVKMNDNILQDHYTLTVEVLHSEGPFPAVLSELYFIKCDHHLPCIYCVHVTKCQ